jgi:hypothetical protein
LQSLQALGDEALSPAADGVAVAAQFGSDVLVGRGVGRGGTQDDAAPKNERLRRGAGAHQVLEVDAQFRRQFDRGGKGAWHGRPPGEKDKAIFHRGIMATVASFG